VTPRPGEKPGATIANTIDVKVKDPKRLEKLKVGDEINVTYTEALLLTVDAKK
jgi:hypothetical protein